MQQDSVHILITRPIDESWIGLAKESGLNLEVVSFIETEIIQSVELQQEIEQVLLQSASVAFTSPNAVEAVGTQLDGLDPAWEIFCIGNKTKELVEHYFGRHHIAGFANDATELAQVILDSIKDEKIIFFCGDQRRPELPSILEDRNIDVEEIVVYQTIAVPKKLKKEYQGILFFSPSAVESFFKLNNAGEKTIFFSIGNTTAAAIKRFSKNKILISDQPGKNNLLEMAIEYFT